MKVIFVSIPYSHKDKKVVEYRVKQLEQYCVELFNTGNLPVSPILTFHHLLENFKLASDFGTWDAVCKEMIKRSDECHFLLLPEWESSIGLAQEKVYAFEFERPIYIINKDPLLKE